MNDALNAIYKSITINELNNLYQKINENSISESEKINYLCENDNGTFTAIDNNLGDFEQDTFLTKESAIQFLAYPLRRDHIHEKDIINFYKEREKNMNEKYPYLKQYLSHENYNIIEGSVHGDEEYKNNVLMFLDESLRLYYETDDLALDTFDDHLYSKTGRQFNSNIIKLSDDVITIEDFLENSNLEEGFKEKIIKDLITFGLNVDPYDYADNYSGYEDASKEMEKSLENSTSINDMIQFFEIMDEPGKIINPINQKDWNELYGEETLRPQEIIDELKIYQNLNTKQSTRTYSKTENSTQRNEEEDER